MIHRQTVATAFDESFYLDEYPDVRAAVAEGHFTSGRDHYERFGRREKRRPLPFPGNPPEDRFPAELPPAELRRRVHGAQEVALFERAGKVACDNLVDALAPRRVLTARSRVLDFGCGCGRVMAYLHRKLPAQLTGTDIDAEAIGWCRARLKDMATFTVNGCWPPLSFADEVFDVVYSISVFTHLPEDMQTAWLVELRRVTKAGGLLLLSVHSPGLIPHEQSAARAAMRQSGFCFFAHGGTAGLPEFYQSAFHAESYVRRHWGQYFAIEAVCPKAVCEHQDLVICTKAG
jgi:SAM-dependent methyltransferase